MDKDRVTDPRIEDTRKRAIPLGMESAAQEFSGISRENLRGRLLSQLHRASMEGRKAEKLDRLITLLRENPEVAEILELLAELNP